MTFAMLPALAMLAMLQAMPEQSAGDPRIRLLPYDPDQITTIGVSEGFASVIELADDERVDNVVVGNSSSWQVTANRAGDRVIVKPLSGAAMTNLIVLTGSRRYVFLLDPFGQNSFVLRFTYPRINAEMTTATPASNFKFRGNKALFPRAMYGDGSRTVIRWSEQTPLPAVFAMNRAGEQLVNGRMVGSDFVIEGAASRYRFRYGRAEAMAIRQLEKRRP